MAQISVDKGKLVISSRIDPFDPNLTYNYFMLFLNILNVGALITGALGIWRMVEIIYDQVHCE